MVKFPASSKLPAGPKPRTEPFAPPPGVLCQSIGCSGRVSDEQWTRNIAAARTTVARMRVMRAPWKGLYDALKGRPRAAFASIPAAAPTAATRGRGRHVDECRNRGIGRIGQGAVRGGVHGRSQLIPIRGDRAVRGQHRTPRARGHDLVRGGVLVEVVDSSTRRDGDVAGSLRARDRVGRDVHRSFCWTAVVRPAAGDKSEQDPWNDRKTHGFSNPSRHYEPRCHFQILTSIGRFGYIDRADARPAGAPSNVFPRISRHQCDAFATILKSIGTSSSTGTRPPAAVVGLIPKSDCLT